MDQVDFNQATSNMFEEDLDQSGLEWCDHGRINSHASTLKGIEGNDSFVESRKWKLWSSQTKEKNSSIARTMNSFFVRND